MNAAIQAALREARDALRAIAIPAPHKLTEAQLRDVLRAQEDAAREALRQIEAVLPNGANADPVVTAAIMCTLRMEIKDGDNLAVAHAAPMGIATRDRDNGA